MMLNTLRGLVLAAGVAAVPAFAQAECPPPESIDRYAQTARDALVALDGLVPEEQQRGLEDRYAAMSILRWSGQGRDIILNDQSALNAISQCIESRRCSAEAAERSGAGPRTIAPFPSDRLVNWANRQLECELVATASEAETAAPEPVDQEPVPEPEEEIVETDDPAPEAVAETIPSQPIDDTPPETDPTADAEPEIADPVPPADITVDDTEPETDDLATADVTDETLAIEPDPTPDDDALSTAETTPQAATAPMARASIVEEDAYQRLVRTAVTTMMRGDVTSSVDAISQACVITAEQADPVATCELVFNHYEYLATRADPIRFLAFTDQLCRLNYARGCANLARYFGVSTTAEAHLAAIKFYDRACNRGDADACAAASDYFLTGRASVADPARARDTLYQSCDLGRLASCQDLAEFYARGVGGEIDLVRALELNDVSCPIGQNAPPATCVAAANFILLNLEAGSERDTRVRTYIERACRAGHDVGCAWHADNLEFGIGGDIDPAGAKQARGTACRLGHRASCDANS
ncbi:MAG: hypothetical protein NXH78_01475 [Hyphomonadaceae bacterium]|nr:hypothetical protein [Hyphomonadaceae bacterium]